MSQHPLNPALPRGYQSNLCAGFFSHFLIRDRFKKLANPNTTGVSCGPTRGENMIGANRFIPIRYRRLWTNEEGTIVGQPVGIVIRVTHVEL